LNPVSPVLKKNMVVALLLILFSLQSLVTISSKSATFDEVQYFGIGKYLLTDRKWDIMGAILHPPLSYYLNGIPLLFINEDKRLWQYDIKERGLEFLGAIDYYRGQELLSSPQNAGDRLLIASRCMTLLTALLLGFYVYRFSTDLFGERGGIFSLFLFAFCPNMLAYSGIAVPDMPVTVFLFISVYYFWKCLCREDRGSLLPAGLSLGLALLSKFTAILLLPILVILTAAHLYATRKNRFPALLLVVGLGALVLWAGYRFALTPFLQGNQYRISQQQIGQAAFFLGTYSNHGWWYFYPVVLLLKTPLPGLLLFCPALVLLFRGKSCGRLDVLFLLLPAAVVFVFFCLSGYAVGIRYLLPLYPFLFVAAGSLLSYGNRSKLLIADAELWYVIPSLHFAPHYLADFNGLAGGAANGYKFRAGCTLGWGQVLTGLKRFMDINRIDKVHLSYFGADTPRRYGINYDWLPSHYLANNEPVKRTAVDQNQLIAVSVTNLQGVYLDDRQLFKRLLQLEPVAQIGYSIHVYALPGRRGYRRGQVPPLARSHIATIQPCVNHTGTGWRIHSATPA